MWGGIRRCGSRYIREFRELELLLVFAWFRFAGANKVCLKADPRQQHLIEFCLALSNEKSIDRSKSLDCCCSN